MERDHNASGRCEQVDGDVVNVRSGEQLRELGFELGDHVFEVVLIASLERPVAGRGLRGGQKAMRF